MTAYYNEFDPQAAAWLRRLIKNGNIAPGIVDERSIMDVEPSDLEGFTQHHFFAGVGVWSLALRNSGWSDDIAVCTASLPCQPFSVAGSGKGKDDERHLLPHFMKLAGAMNFPVIFGEQVDAAIRHGWLDDLYSAMGGYEMASHIIPAAAMGAPHIRSRLWWVAKRGGANDATREHERRIIEAYHAKQSDLQRGGEVNKNTWWNLRNENYSDNTKRGQKRGLSYSKNRVGWSKSQRSASFSWKARYESGRDGEHSRATSTIGFRQQGKRGKGKKGIAKYCKNLWTGSTKYARRCEKRSDTVQWLYCRDKKYRAIKPSIKPLVNGVARGVVYSGSAIDPNNSGLARAIRIKGYGNAIVEPVARVFIRSFMASV